MSASDAAPLPRLGEVFFDVRGSSRSMRLSWYSDTGIAVFSIWQGGMCTGTFRLPIGDLPRMIEVLQRGPEDQEPPRPPQGRRAGREPGRSARPEFRTGALLHPDRDASPAAYGYEDETDAPAYRDARPRGARSEPGQDEVGSARASRHGRDDATQGHWSQPDPEPTTGPWPGSGPGNGGDQSWSGPGLDDERDRSWPEYEQAGYAEDRDASGYDRDEFSGGSRGGYDHRHHDQSESAGHRLQDELEPAADGYGSQRFVPPYVGSGPGEYGNDIFQGSADPLGDPREGAYREDPGHGRSQPDDYDRDPWPEDGYSDGPSYRLAARPAGPDDDTTGRHSASRDGGSGRLDGPPAGYAGYYDQAGEIDTQPGDYRARRVR